MIIIIILYICTVAESVDFKIWLFASHSEIHLFRSTNQKKKKEKKKIHLAAKQQLRKKP